ncbi:hypothetical protein JXL19_11580 [bacterium]|nr:hypothetical protein [bacterium]
MTSIKFFWKQDCPKCPEAKQIFNGLKEKGFKVTDYNLNTADGLAEGTYHSVLSTPTFLVIDDNEREILQWRGDVPTFEELFAVLMSHDVKPQCMC